jgi:hypothetical protein
MRCILPHLRGRAQSRADPAACYASLAGFRAYVITALAVAGAGALIWTVLDRRRREYRRVYAWLRVYLRYMLAALLLPYGMAKLVPAQFPTPSLVQLITPLGEFTRMRLLWLSIAAAPAYQIFTGACEVSGALLLLSRRTTTLGALILTASLSNVLVLNLAYGIGVQLNVSVYLLMAVVLLAPEARKLMDVLFRTPTGPTEKSVWRVTAVAKWLVVMWMIGVCVEKSPWRGATTRVGSASSSPSARQRRSRARPAFCSDTGSVTTRRRRH